MIGGCVGLGVIGAGVVGGATGAGVVGAGTGAGVVGSGPLLGQENSWQTFPPLPQPVPTDEHLESLPAAHASASEGAHLLQA